MDFSRRLFLGGLATAFAASKVGMSDRAFASIPVLYGDGIRDDAPALNAWLRGDPVKIANARAGIIGERYLIQRANLAIGSTVRAENVSIDMFECHVRALPGFRGDTLMYIGGDGSKPSTIYGGYFDASAIELEGSDLTFNRDSRDVVIGSYFEGRETQRVTP